MKEALRAAIIAAIEEVGMDVFKRTSLFMSNHREGSGGDN